MSKRYFQLQLPDEVVRGMNRQQYKKASHQLRFYSWRVNARINWPAVTRHLADVAIYGCSVISTEDMLR